MRYVTSIIQSSNGFYIFIPHLSNYSSKQHLGHAWPKPVGFTGASLGHPPKRRRREKWGSDHVETLRNKRVLAEWGDLGGCQWLAMVGARVMIDDGHNFHWLTGVHYKDLVT